MNRFIGSVLIVAGTTIGAGMLAMPILSAQVGFGAMCLILIGIWMAMYYTSIVLVKVYAYHAPEDGLNTITHHYLGRWGAFITAASMLGLMYALVSAYIAGGSELLRTQVHGAVGWSIEPHTSSLFFVLFFGGLIAFGTQLVDWSTKVVFTLKLVFLFFIIFSLLPHIEPLNLTQTPQNTGVVFSTIPIIFTSFGFCVVIPSLVSYLKGDSRQLKRVFLLGSLMPLILYLIWELVVLGSVNPKAFASIIQQNSGLEGLIIAIQKLQQNPYIGTATSLFAAAAILTSFLGVSLALYHYILDLGKRKWFSKNSKGALLLTFSPPLLFALFYPDGFIMALGYASIALVVLALIMPMLMLQKAQKSKGISSSLSQKFIFILLWLLAILIVALQLLMGMGLL